MSEDQEIVKAVFVVLSKLRRVEGDETPAGGGELMDLERALGMLAGLCDGEERSNVIEWASKFEATRGEIEAFSSEMNRKIRGLSTNLEFEVINILMRRLPEDKREEVREKLSKILDGGDDLALEGLRGSEGDRSPRSGLEDKLKKLEDDEPPPGLDKYMENGKTG